MLHLRIHPDNPQPRLISQAVERIRAGDVVVFIRDGIRKAAHERGAAVPAVLSEQSERFCGGADMQCVWGDRFNRGFHVALHLFLYGLVCF